MHFIMSNFTLLKITKRFGGYTFSLVQGQLVCTGLSFETCPNALSLDISKKAWQVGKYKYSIFTCKPPDELHLII